MAAAAMCTDDPKYDANVRCSTGCPPAALRKSSYARRRIARSWNAGGVVHCMAARDGRREFDVVVAVPPR
jgi:hypothetical protein